MLLTSSQHPLIVCVRARVCFKLSLSVHIHCVFVYKYFYAEISV